MVGNLIELERLISEDSDIMYTEFESYVEKLPLKIVSSFGISANLLIDLLISFSLMLGGWMIILSSKELLKDFSANSWSGNYVKGF